MIARTKSVVIPVIIATISEDGFREILGDGSCRYAYDEKNREIVDRELSRWKAAWAKSLAMDNPQRRTRATSLRWSVRNGKVASIPVELAMHRSDRRGG
jgi:hypothetical protein